MSKQPKWTVLSHGYRWECNVNGTTVRIDRVGRVMVSKRVSTVVYRDANAY